MEIVLRYGSDPQITTEGDRVMVTHPLLGEEAVAVRLPVRRDVFIPTRPVRDEDNQVALIVCDGTIDVNASVDWHVDGRDDVIVRVRDDHTTALALAKAIIAVLDRAQTDPPATLAEAIRLLAAMADWAWNTELRDFAAWRTEHGLSMHPSRLAAVVNDRLAHATQLARALAERSDLPADARALARRIAALITE